MSRLFQSAFLCHILTCIVEESCWPNHPQNKPRTRRWSVFPGKGRYSSNALKNLGDRFLDPPDLGDNAYRDQLRGSQKKKGGGCCPKPTCTTKPTAFAHVECIIWPDGPVFPHCGVIDRGYRHESVKTKPSAKNPEGKGVFRLVEVPRVPQAGHRPQGHGSWKRAKSDCAKWLQAVHLMVSSTEGISNYGSTAS